MRFKALLVENHRLTVFGRNENYCVACARVVRVVSLHRLDKLEEANEELNKLDNYVREHTAAFQLAPGVNWGQVLYYEALRKSIEDISHY